MKAKRKSKDEIDSLIKDGIPENSVTDNVSIGRGTKRRSSIPAQSSPPKHSRTALKDPLITIGHVFTQGKKSVVIPQEVHQSTPQTFQKEGFVTIQSATKKPKGKGFSMGSNGEKTVVVHKSPRPKRNIKKPKKLDDMVTDFDSQEQQM